MRVALTITGSGPERPAPLRASQRRTSAGSSVAFATDAPYTPRTGNALMMRHRENGSDGTRTRDLRRDRPAF